jgi:hypothetical protein
VQTRVIFADSSASEEAGLAAIARFGVDFH